MNLNSSNTTAVTPDAVQEVPFDPLARQFDGSGRPYVNFHALLCGEADPQDDCNVRIAALVTQGRSEAFCREYRKGWDSKAAEVRGQSIAHQVKRGDWTSPQAIREGFGKWKPGYTDRQNIHKAAETCAKLTLGGIARTAGILDAGSTPR